MYLELRGYMHLSLLAMTPFCTAINADKSEELENCPRMPLYHYFNSYEWRNDGSNMWNWFQSILSCSKC